MKAVILSAGQGKRLLPWTATVPKSLLSLHGQPLLIWQIEALARCGIDEVVVVVGYGAPLIEEFLADRYGRGKVATLYNPVFDVTDNLISCWLASTEMNTDFLLLNGDTVFEPALLERLLGQPPRPITVAIDSKPHYDADDMKVSRVGEQLVRIGKDLPHAEVDGESIGMLLFRGHGSTLFRQAMGRAVRRPQARKCWYLTAINELARSGGNVWTCSIQGLRWAEVDCPADLERAKQVLASRLNAFSLATTPGLD